MCARLVTGAALNESRLQATDRYARSLASKTQHHKDGTPQRFTPLLVIIARSSQRCSAQGWSPYTAKEGVPSALHSLRPLPPPLPLVRYLCDLCYDRGDRRHRSLVRCTTDTLLSMAISAHRHASHHGLAPILNSHRHFAWYKVEAVSCPTLHRFDSLTLPFSPVPTCP